MSETSQKGRIQAEKHPTKGAGAREIAWHVSNCALKRLKVGARLDEEEARALVEP